MRVIRPIAGHNPLQLGIVFPPLYLGIKLYSLHYYGTEIRPVIPFIIGSFRVYN